MKNKKHIKVNMLFALLVVLIIILMFLVNGISYILSNRYHLKFDLTANAAYEVGDETQTVLESLTDDLTIYVLSTPEGFDGTSYLVQVRSIIEQYPKHSDHINLEYIDYEANPAFAAGYSDLSLSAGNILITYGEEVQQIALSSMFNYAYDATGNPVIESSRAEEAITSAIINAISEEQISIALLTGNDTVDMPDFVKLLVDNNYEVSYVNMATESFNEFDLCMLFAPTIDLSEGAIQKIDTFLNNNGEYGKTLLYTADATQPQLPNLEAFLSEWGVIIGDGSIFETKSERTYQYQPFFPVVQYVDSEYQNMLKDPNSPFLMPLSKPIDVLYEVQDRQYTKNLLSFYETAGIRPQDAGDNFDSDMTEEWGPFPGIVSASRRIADISGIGYYSSEIIVSASTHMLDPDFLYDSSLSNSDYILNLLNDKTGREDTFKVEPKSLSGDVLGITTGQSTRIAIVLCIIAPISILVVGISIWLYRRYK